MSQPYIVCPRCGGTSHNPNDIRERYCGYCHRFHDDPPAPTDVVQDAFAAGWGACLKDNFPGSTIDAEEGVQIAMAYDEWKQTGE